MINGNYSFNAKINSNIYGNNELNDHNKHKVNYDMYNKSQNLEKSNPKILSTIHELNEYNHKKKIAKILKIMIIKESLK